MNQGALAIHILCSQMAAQAGAQPFSPAEWSKFALLLYGKGKSPVDVLGMDAQSLASDLELDKALIDRILKLQDRSVAIGFELDEYENIGIGFVTRDNSEAHIYPARIKEKLGNDRPPLFCYAGELSILNEKCLGFAGSRNIGEEETDFTQVLAKRAVHNGFAVVSGGAKGVDTAAINTALSEDGKAVVFLADSMMDKLRRKDIIRAVQNGSLLLISPYKPDADWTVGNAMARNKYIYVQSDGVAVVKSDFEKGGTWAGAEENLDKRWTLEYCWDNKAFPGNQALIRKGAVPIDDNWDCIPKTEDKNGSIKNENQSVSQISLFE